VPTTTTPRPTAPPTTGDRFPLAALLVMALTGFLLLATETMPAGLLTGIARGMGTTQAASGQLVSTYALGTILVTLPAVAWTRSMRRKPVLLLALLGFLLMNVVVGLSHQLALSYAARFIAGGLSGLLWGMLAGYARRITAPDRAGRALAIASIGTPLGLALGTPVGSWLGDTLGWRWSFGALSLLTVATITLAIALVPDAPGQAAATHMPLRRVITIPGVLPVLAVITTWMVAHNSVYTYLEPYLHDTGTRLSVGLALVIFGLAALIGLAITAALIDGALRQLTLGSIALFVIAGGLLWLSGGSSAVVLVAIVLWGIGYGGAATLLQTAIANAAGPHADVANSMLGVAFNLAIFGAGVLGAVVISAASGLALATVMVVLALTALAIAATSHTSTQGVAT
jgi:predicted MFS family arabinose efflux permease